MFKVVSGKCNGSISYYLFQDVLNDLFIHFYSLMKLRYSVKFRDISFFFFIEMYSILENFKNTESSYQGKWYIS